MPDFPTAFERTIAHVTDGVGRDYSGAAAAVVHGDRVLMQFSVGNTRDDSGDAHPKPITPQTLFDMASVSKLMSTTMVALRLLEQGRLSIFDPLSLYFDNVGSYRNVEVRHLMTHTSGLNPYIPLYRQCSSPDDVLRTILDSEPVCRVGEQVNYSCMGYILLQKLLEKLTDTPLDILARELVFDPLGLDACYAPTTDDVVATEFSGELGRCKCGEVHDENAYFIGGVSGNAGVFASLGDMVKFASMLSGRGMSQGRRFLNARTFELAVENHTAGLNEDRGLGFQLRGRGLSAAGELTSPDSYGHTGFTGTSVYCDGRTGIAMVLLTNAVHYGRDNRTGFFRRRRLFHNVALSEALRVLEG